MLVCEGGSTVNNVAERWQETKNREAVIRQKKEKPFIGINNIFIEPNKYKDTGYIAVG